MIASNLFIHDPLESFGRSTLLKPAGPKKRSLGGLTTKRRLPTKTAKKAVVQPTKPKKSAPRTSDVLLRILDNNPGKSITVQRIVDELGSNSFGASLMVFSLPELLPVHFPGIGAVVAIPNGILASQMIRGKKQIQLPGYLLKRSVPRKLFSSAVHAILPSLQRIERAVSPRGNWMNHALAKRLLGGFTLTLAGVIALPIPWTCTLAALATMLIGLGMVERNGTLVILGMILGLTSIALVAGIVLGAISFLGF